MKLEGLSDYSLQFMWIKGLLFGQSVFTFCVVDVRYECLPFSLTTIVTLVTVSVRDGNVRWWDMLGLPYTVILTNRFGVLTNQM